MQSIRTKGGVGGSVITRGGVRQTYYAARGGRWL